MSIYMENLTLKILGRNWGFKAIVSINLIIHTIHIILTQLF
jgi:hypothetical protein